MNPRQENIRVRPLVVGADGLLGTRLAARLEEHFPHAVSATRTELDITDRWRVEAELERLRPTVLINCAAIADVDACERDPFPAEKVNAEGPAFLAQACRQAGLRMIHFSTDYVFDGAKGAEYVESDPPNPVNQYGRTKLEGEMAVLETLVDAVVLRVSFLFGPGRPNFIDRVAAQARAGGGPVRAVNGWTTKPTYTDDICGAVEQVLLSDVTGLWHFANGPAVSRLAFARGVLQLLGEDPSRAVALDAADLQLPARRPEASVLSTERWAAHFGPPRPWTAAAREYFAQEVRG